jgi:hypothetical protein
MKEKRTRPRSRSLFDVVFDRFANRVSSPPPAPSNPQVEATITRLPAEGILKSPTQPEVEEHKKKHKSLFNKCVFESYFTPLFTRPSLLNTKLKLRLKNR